MELLPYWHPFYLDLEAGCSSQPQAFQNTVLFSNPPVVSIQFTFLKAVFVLLNLLLGCSACQGFCAPGKSPFPSGWLGRGCWARDAGPSVQLWGWDCCPPGPWRGPSSSCQLCPLLGAKKGCSVLPQERRAGRCGGDEIRGAELSPGTPSVLPWGVS